MLNKDELNPQNEWTKHPNYKSLSMQHPVEISSSKSDDNKRHCFLHFFKHARNQNIKDTEYEDLRELLDGDCFRARLSDLAPAAHLYSKNIQ